MKVKQAKAVARQWVMAEAVQLVGFDGAFYHGSINWLADEATLPPTSDVDVMVVLTDPDLPNKPGKFIYQDVLLEISYWPRHQLQSPDVILGQYNIAGSFAVPSIISDPSGQLTRLQAAVSSDYAKHQWVYQRCQNARDKVLHNIESLNESAPFHDQVAVWLFAAGVTTHVLLVAGLKNPTVRRRYVAVQQLLADYHQPDFHKTLLAILGCAQMSRERVEQHLLALTDVFDAASAVVKTPFFFASDISVIARPLAIDGSWQMIERGDHREAMFWIVATYCRCQKILFHDASVAVQDQFSLGFRQLLADLGIMSLADLQQRSEQIKQLLPDVWQVAEAIMAANPEIED